MSTSFKFESEIDAELALGHLAPHLRVFFVGGTNFVEDFSDDF